MSDGPNRPAPPPVVARLRIRYAKRGRMRFTSHRDFARAFERAVRRSGIPIAFSAGFSPHPKISYAGAAPTGVASEAEYLEIGLSAPADPEQVRGALDAALPAGLDVLDVVEARAGARGLAERLDASRWQIELSGASMTEVQAAVDRLLDLDTAPVERLLKEGRRIVDVRPALVAVQLRDASSRHAASAGDPRGGETRCATMDLVVRHTTPAVRPDDVLTALHTAAGLTTPVTTMVTRLAQGQLDVTPAGDPTRLHDPLDPVPDPPASERAPQQQSDAVALPR